MLGCPCLPLPLPPGDRDLYGAPLLVLANKQDVEGAASPAELAEAFGLGRLDGGRPCSVQAVTARTGEGVKPAVQVGGGGWRGGGGWGWGVGAAC